MKCVFPGCTGADKLPLAYTVSGVGIKYHDDGRDQTVVSTVPSCGPHSTILEDDMRVRMINLGAEPESVVILALNMNASVPT